MPGNSCRQAALWPELGEGTLAGNQRSGHPCLHSDDEPVEAPEGASFCADSKSASSVSLVQRIGGDEPDCSFMCRGEFENGYCSVDHKYKQRDKIMLQLPVVRQRLYETSCRFKGIGRVRYSTGTPNKEVQTMIYQIHFGKRIAMLRRKANLSQADLLFPD